LRISLPSITGGSTGGGTGGNSGRNGFVPLTEELSMVIWLIPGKYMAEKTISPAECNAHDWYRIARRLFQCKKCGSLIVPISDLLMSEEEAQGENAV